MLFVVVISYCWSVSNDYCYRLKYGGAFLFRLCRSINRICFVHSFSVCFFVELFRKSNPTPRRNVCTILILNIWLFDVQSKYDAAPRAVSCWRTASGLEGGVNGWVQVVIDRNSDVLTWIRSTEYHSSLWLMLLVFVMVIMVLNLNNFGAIMP